MCVYGIDGEIVIFLVFKERFVFLLVLFCVIYLWKNVIGKIVVIGIEEFERREICVDIFGV